LLVDMLNDDRHSVAAQFVRLAVRECEDPPITSCYVRRDILRPIREKLGIPRETLHCFRHGLRAALMQSGTNARCTAAIRSHRLATAGAVRARIRKAEERR
jgi:integrase